MSLCLTLSLSPLSVSFSLSGFFYLENEREKEILFRLISLPQQVGGGFAVFAPLLGREGDDKTVTMIISTDSSAVCMCERVRACVCVCVCFLFRDASRFTEPV